MSDSRDSHIRNSGSSGRFKQIECEKRGYHRIPVFDFVCLCCGKKVTPEQAIDNERHKLARMDRSHK